MKCSNENAKKIKFTNKKAAFVLKQGWPDPEYLGWDGRQPWRHGSRNGGHAHPWQPWVVSGWSTCPHTSRTLFFLGFLAVLEYTYAQMVVYIHKHASLKRKMDDHSFCPRMIRGIWCYFILWPSCELLEFEPEPLLWSPPGVLSGCLAACIVAQLAGGVCSTVLSCLATNNY